MSDSITNRTPLVIAAEINAIRHQMEKIFLVQAIEIGRRLKEAKDLLPYGEWGKWLEETVNYTQRTADRFMLIFEAYGSNQPAFPEVGAQAQELPSLTSSQALILLGLPKQDRAQFLVDLDVEGLSTREMKKAVDNWKLAQQEKDRALEERDQARQDNENLRQGLNEEKDKNAGMSGERDNLKAEVDVLKKVRQKLEQDMENKKAEYDKLKERIGYKNIEKMSASLTAAHNKAEANKIAFLYDSLDRTFKELAYEMARFAGKNPEVHAMYQEKVKSFLLNALKEKL
ncbi:DUF3102 domain-containing protein [Desulfosporosinus sp. PR]|uniref:DUF3102 domain-containing protein n=1 Tax=Candidatus Desulfosporosinus nitrosoreducens TaxID=3401928 RepID=UPI0027EC9DB5|nr:DUF3102 domain-containing protein [Desulfosporosinus sp. PR]MDQ7092611.1 DUF3102 domain-containing protein [Desulfosporosinus sp. PR]